MHKKIGEISNLKKQNVIIEGKIRDNHELTNVKHANNLHKCTNYIGMSDEAFIRYGACGSPYCPICSYFKKRLKIAQYHKIYEHLVKNELLDKYNFYHLTLNMEECHVSKVNSTTEQLKKGRSELVKVLDKLTVGSAINIHYKIKEFDSIKLHLHIVMMVDSTNDLINLITEDKWQNIWMKCLGVNYYPDVDCRPIGTDKIITADDLVDVLSYGLKHIKDEDIKNHPETYLKLMDKIYGSRKTELYKELRELRSIVENEYKNTTKNLSKSKTIDILKFNGKKFKKERVLTPKI